MLHPAPSFRTASRYWGPCILTYVVGVWGGCRTRDEVRDGSVPERASAQFGDDAELETKPPHLANAHIDVQHYDVSLTFRDMTAQEIPVTATLTIKLLKQSRFVKLHTHKQLIKMHTVTLGTESLRYDILQGVAGSYGLTGDVLQINLPSEMNAEQELVLRLEYTVAPDLMSKDRGLIYRSRHHGAPIFNTRNWPYYTRFWLPSNDHPSDPATIHTRLQVPSAMVGAANGSLVAGTYKDGSGMNSEGLRVFEWDQSTAIPTYGMNITVGQLEITQRDICFNLKSTKDIPVLLENSDCAPERNTNIVRVPYVYYIQKNHGEATEMLKQAESGIEAMMLFSKELSQYPYQKLGFVTAPHPFNMESVSLMVMVTPEATVHEVAHHWWGNTVYIEHWGDFWISEGFTTYFTGFFDEIKTGRNTACRQETGRLNNPPETDPLTIFDDTAYCKGASAVAAMREMLAKLAKVEMRSAAERKIFWQYSRRLFEAHKFQRLGSLALVQYMRAQMKDFLAEHDITVTQAAVDEAVDRWQGTWLTANVP